MRTKRKKKPLQLLFTCLWVVLKLKNEEYTFRLCFSGMLHVHSAKSVRI